MSYVTKSEIQEMLNQRLLPVESTVQQMDSKLMSRDAEYQRLELRLGEVLGKVKDLEKVSFEPRSSDGDG